MWKIIGGKLVDKKQTKGSKGSTKGSNKGVKYHIDALLLALRTVTNDYQL